MGGSVEMQDLFIQLVGTEPDVNRLLKNFLVCIYLRQ